jgi:uncharacterized membrane protein YdbT with pleckstrin-like domain
MAEETIWIGTSSQAKNLSAFVASGVVLILILVAAGYCQQWLVLLGLPLPLGYAAYRYLKVSSREYKLTSERLVISDGILSKTTDSLELYRVKDLRVVQPLSLRMFGLENIELSTSDKSTPDIVLDSVPKSAGLGDQCRTYVEACRTAKGTREVELE